MNWVPASSNEGAYLTTLTSHSLSPVQQAGRDSAHRQTYYSYLFQHWSKHQETAALPAYEEAGGELFFSESLSSLDLPWALFVFVVMLWEGVLFAPGLSFYEHHRKERLLMQNWDIYFLQ